MTAVVSFDGGGTRTRGGLYDAEGTLLAEAEGPPSNPVDHGVYRSAGILMDLHDQLTQGHHPPVDVITAGIAGASHKVYAEYIASALVSHTGARRAVVTSDLIPLLKANLAGRPGVIVIAGTGASVVIQDNAGTMHRAGGRSPVFGDPGSAYAIAAAGLRAAADALDDIGDGTVLTERLPAAAMVHSFADLVVWAANETKADIARLAKTVSHAADEGDSVAAHCVEDQAEALADLTAKAVRACHLQFTDSVLIHGGLFTHCSRYRHAYMRRLEVALPGAEPTLPEFEGHHAAWKMASITPPPAGAVELHGDTMDAQLVTERRVPGAPHLDLLAPPAICQFMSNEDRQAVRAVANAAPAIAQAMEIVASAFSKGGRLIYVGAGTSGRLGVLDAAECPPTFGAPPGMVVALIAGGERALTESVEGAEDDASQAVNDLHALTPSVNSNDAVAGISASGGAAYVREALSEARRAGAQTIVVTCNRPRQPMADVTIVLDTGPEVLPGSTRLKAGTATKLVLNQISTGAMALSGRIFEGLMVGVQPVNIKLRERSSGIVAQLTGTTRDEASRLLDEAGNRISVAVLMARRNLTAKQAEVRLKETGGQLREALERV